MHGLAVTAGQVPAAVQLAALNSLFGEAQEAAAQTGEPVTAVHAPVEQDWQTGQLLAPQQMPSTQLPETQSEPALHTAPLAALAGRHMPPSAHMPLVHPESAVPATTGKHAPPAPQLLQASQEGFPQHTPSTQLPEVHSVPAVHAVPLPFIWQVPRVLPEAPMHWNPLAQSAVVAQEVLHVIDVALQT